MCCAALLDAMLRMSRYGLKFDTYNAELGVFPCASMARLSSFRLPSAFKTTRQTHAYTSVSAKLARAAAAAGRPGKTTSSNHDRMRR